MFSDPVFIVITLLASLGLLFCLSILINTLSSNLWKNSAYAIAFLMLSSFIYLNYEAVSNLKESQEQQANKSSTLWISLKSSLLRIPMT